MEKGGKSRSLNVWVGEVNSNSLGGRAEATLSPNTRGFSTLGLDPTKARSS